MVSSIAFYSLQIRSGLIRRENKSIFVRLESKKFIKIKLIALFNCNGNWARLSEIAAKSITIPMDDEWKPFSLLSSYSIAMPSVSFRFIFFTSLSSSSHSIDCIYGNAATNTIPSDRSNSAHYCEIVLGAWQKPTSQSISSSILHLIFALHRLMCATYCAMQSMRFIIIQQFDVCTTTCNDICRAEREMWNWRFGARTTGIKSTNCFSSDSSQEALAAAN